MPSKTLEPLSFRLDLRAPERRRILVTLECGRDTLVAGLADGEATLFLPTWTPGSYLIREYARHLSAVTAADAHTGVAIPCQKVSKNRFRLTLPGQVRRIRVTYQVYAHELSVRTADVTPEHAYWNHACVLLWPLGQRDCKARITLLLPAGWQLATSLSRIDGPAAHRDEIVLSANDLDHAMDSPCLAGVFTRLDWLLRGVPHSVILEGLNGVCAPASFLDDLTAILERASDVFGGQLPYASYQFHCLFTESGHGGLEHADSTTLLAARTAMRPGKGYQQFLSLCAHEFFHVWNVKRMRPRELWDYDYEVENYTPMLWLAEGFTAYYDDLLCLRAGVISRSDYLALLAKSIGTVFGSMGRFKQSLADSSFDAWIRLYRPDENTRNSTQNYYVNGSIAALVLDLMIRQATDGGASLDDALRILYRTTFLAGRGYTHADVVAALSEAARRDMATTVDSLVRGSLDPELRPLLLSFGIELTNRDRDRPYLGLAFADDSTRISFVNDDGPALAAGLAPGDEILGLDGIRVQSASWSEVFGTIAAVGRSLRVLIASRGRILERVVTPTEPPVGTIGLEVLDAAPEPAVRLRRQWLDWPDRSSRKSAPGPGPSPVTLPGSGEQPTSGTRPE
ncbi:MAG: M61 family metallopeptidase [Planctomycetes bacterium]|nr:M61 family metallopeptidase [Planctomycetota bacterium]